MAMKRALHFVFKVADRKATSHFYRNVLGMKVLRHEEFTEGCEAACNGPYDNRWSKTMVGYGPEDTHFAIELTYNYNVGNYKRGNDFIGIIIRSREAIARAKATNYPTSTEGQYTVLEAPGGYKYFLIDGLEVDGRDPVERVILACSDITESMFYWKNVLGMELFERTNNSILMGFPGSHVKLELKCIGGKLDRAEAYGRIAFSTPLADLPVIENKVREGGYKILTPMLKLDTPGKASVTVVILADPDGHEICFVDDENFRQLSAVDPDGARLLDRYIIKDDARKAQAN